MELKIFQVDAFVAVAYGGDIAAKPGQGAVAIAKAQLSKNFIIGAVFFGNKDPVFDR